MVSWKSRNYLVFYDCFKFQSSSSNSDRPPSYPGTTEASASRPSIEATLDDHIACDHVNSDIKRDHCSTACQTETWPSKICLYMFSSTIRISSPNPLLQKTNNFFTILGHFWTIYSPLHLELFLYHFWEYLWGNFWYHFLGYFRTLFGPIFEKKIAAFLRQSLEQF